MTRLYISILLIFSSSMALADQCTAISEKQSKMSLRALMDAEQVQYFCEPCEEKQPTVVDVVSLGFKKTSESTYNVEINGQAVDVAYIYANGMNVASLVSCKTKGVRQFIPQNKQRYW